MKDLTTITIKLDKTSKAMLKDYVDTNTDLSVNQFILNAIAEKLENNGEHFFWTEHSENVD